MKQETIIELSGISKFYGDYCALKDINLKLQSGAIGLLGPNGAGKTTLIKMMLGLLGFTGGQGRVCGFDIATEQRQVRTLTGYMPESDCYFAGLTGVGYVTFAGELAGLPNTAAKQRAHEMLDYVGIAEARYREIQTYSAGMKQRLKLAQSIVHDPKLIFLDEPTNGMDPKGREEIMELLRDLRHNKGISFMLSSHILPDVEELCDSVIIMDKGEILKTGGLSELGKTSDNSWLLRLRGDILGFKDRLLREGFVLLNDPNLGPEDLRVRIPDEEARIGLFELLEEAGAQLRRFQPSRTDLQAVYNEVILRDQKKLEELEIKKAEQEEARK